MAVVLFVRPRFPCSSLVYLHAAIPIGTLLPKKQTGQGRFPSPAPLLPASGLLTSGCGLSP